MKLGVFVVRDSAVNAYLPPFYARTTGEAIRSFTEACNNPEHQFAKHYMDYVLYRLGDWDDFSGEFQCVEPMRVLAAVEVREV